jgi:CubicO group peptidase (beta-lactamase class C family)
MATTVSVMKLYDEGRLDLSKTLGDYLPWTKGTNKAHLGILDVLTHQAGLKAWIPFYRETVDTLGKNEPFYGIYARRKDTTYPIRVAENIFLRKDWIDTIYTRILTSEVAPRGKYIYSDLDFIFMGKIVEAITGKPLERYVQETFYGPLQMKSTGFRPRDRFPL